MREKRQNSAKWYKQYLNHSLIYLGDTLSPFFRAVSLSIPIERPPSKDVQTAANVKWPIFIGKDVKTAAKGELAERPPSTRPRLRGRGEGNHHSYGEKLDRWSGPDCETR